MLVLGLAENSYLQGGKYAHSSLSEGLRILLIGLTLPQVVLIVRIHRDGIALRASSDEIHPCSTVYPASLFSVYSYRKSLLTELFLHCLVVPPRINGDLALLGHPEVRIPDLLFLLSVLRGYHFLRLLYWLLPIEDARTEFYCNLQGVAHKVGFYLRKALVGNAGTSVLVWAAISLYCALCLFIFERESQSQFHSFWDSIWAIVKTEELMGGRDVSPDTDLGRVVLIAATLVGIVTLSLLLHIIEAKLRMTKAEEHFAAEFLCEELKKEKLKPAAAHFIQKCWRLKTRKKGLWSFLRACHVFVFWRQCIESRLKSGWDLERRGKNWQFSFALANSQLIPLLNIKKLVVVMQAYTLSTQSFSQGKVCHSIYKGVKECRQVYLDMVMPGYREKRLSMASRASSVASNSINFKRLRTLMARDRYLRSVTSVESAGNSPRVSFDNLRNGEEHSTPRLFL